MRRGTGIAAVLSALALAGCSSGRDAPATGSDVEAEPAPTTTVKIVSDLPLRGSSAAQSESIVNAIELYLDLIDHRTGDFIVDYESIDGTSYSGGAFDESPCVDRPHEYLDEDGLVGVVGTFNSFCAKVGVPIANEGSLVYVSPANTAVGLTHKGPGSEPGEPDKYYPTGVRTYARVVAPDDVQGGIDAAYMKDLGVTKVFLLDDRDAYGTSITAAFEVAAGELGLEVVGHRGWDAAADNYHALMRDVKASGADGVFIGGISDFNGDQVVRDKVAIVGDNEAVKLMVSDGFVGDYLFDDIEPNVIEGAYGSAPALNPDELTGAGAEFIDAYTAKYGEPEVYTAYGAAAAQVLIDAIGLSDGTRAGVAAALLETDIADGILGPTSFDANGDIEDPAIAIFRAESGRWAPLETVRPSDFGDRR